MTSELSTKLNELKEYNSKKSVEKLNKRVYSLDIDENFTSNMDNNTLLYIHVKLHTMFSVNRKNNDSEKIKKIHDLIVKKLKNHQKNDDLDT